MKKLIALLLTLVFVVGLIPPAIATSVHAAEGDKPIVMSVKAWDYSEEIYKEFDNFEDGWVYICETVYTYFDDFDVKLYADWIAPDGRFYYTDEDGDETGTDNGRLYFDSSWFVEGGHTNYNKINIDLNGHKIDRNLKEPTKNGQVFYIKSGTIRIFDSSKEQTGMITGANNIGNGGAFLVDNGILNLDMSALYIEGGTITGNYATNGGAIYWNSDGVLIITDGVITGNQATENGGGLYINDWGRTYVGGTPVIKDNYIKGTSKQSNLYVGDTDAIIKLTKGQKTEFFSNDIPDLPLSEGAQIGLSAPGDDEKLTDESSLFREGDFNFFFPDDSSYFVRSVYEEKDGVTSYNLYYTSWQNENKRAPRVTNVSIKDNNLVKDIDFNYDKQILTLKVADNKRDYFEVMALDRLVSFEFNDERYYIDRAENPRNLHERQQYRITADNGTYVLLIVNVVPEGGKWTETQDPYETEFNALVYNEHYTAGYTDIGKAWADAVKRSHTHPTTFKLFADWVATDGMFYAEDADGDEYGTDDGYLFIDDEEIELTIDLNGHNIDRNLDKAVSDGYVFYIGEGLITITDTSKDGNGKITGGNNTGDGGAIFMNDGLFGAPTRGATLTINGGNISGNHSDESGGAIYSEAPSTAVVMNGGKITNNTAQDGGAIALGHLSTAYMYGGEISENSATKYGGAFYCYDGRAVVTESAVVCNNTAKYGGCAYISDYGSFGFYCGYIKNNTADYGGGVFANGPFYMGGADAYIMNNVAKYDGGGVYATGSEGGIRTYVGNIKGNKAVNGAGIYWRAAGKHLNGGNDCILNHVIITENVASGIGGGVYVPDEKNIYAGGKTVIKDNASSLGTDNIYLAGEESAITSDIVGYYGINLEEGAEIGVRAEQIKGERIIVSKEGGFDETAVNYITSDDNRYYIKSIADANYNGYRLSLVDNYDGEMVVGVEGQEARSFTNFNEGWVYALKQSITKPTTITLGADWIAHNGSFYCVDESGSEYGTNDGYLYINDDHNLTIDLNGHKIDRNLATATEDGLVFWLYDYDAKLTIKDSVGGGKITGANNTGNGGAFFVQRGSLYIEGGEITGNQAKNGAGIYWESRNNLCVYGGKISQNTASENGGGIYGTDWGKMYFGGNVIISGNTGKGSVNNLYLEADDVFVNLTAGQLAGIPDVPFEADASIGISAYDSEALISGENSCFGWYDNRYFSSDNNEYYIRKVYDAGGVNNEYKLYIDSVKNMPASSEEVLIVAVEGGATQSFGNFSEGWAYALKQSVSKPTTVTLCADWIADNGAFRCSDEKGKEYGSKNGYLYINDDHNLTIDLNGHKIDRNLTEATDNGLVFWLYDYDAKLTIKDSVGGGKITGANNTGNGGAFFVQRGSLYIEGGEITGNQAKNGAGIYWESRSNLCVYGGEISGNTASENGGGIYGTDWGKMYFGGNVRIFGNSGKDSENNNLYLDDDDVFVNQTAGQSDEIPNVPLVAGATIGISAYDTDALISGENSCFDQSYPDFEFFFADSDKNYIRSIYNENGGNNSLKLYITTKSPEMIPNALTVSVEGGTSTVFEDFSVGWAYALKQSLTNPTIITLGADWIARDGSFYCVDEDGDEYGSKNGYLYLNDDHNLTIDLNGHKISRNLQEAVEDGEVIYLSYGNLVIDDTSEENNGSITGGYNIGYGGGVYIDEGILTLKGGSISGNKVINSGNIYTSGHGGGIWADGATIIIDGGSVSNNYSDGNGAGIWAEDCTITITDGCVSHNELSSGREAGGIYAYDGCTLNIEGGEISYNNGGGVFCEEDVNVYMKGGIIGYNTNGSGIGFRDSAYSVPNMYMTGGSIIGNKTTKTGGGIHWNSTGVLCLTGGIITENYVTVAPNGSDDNPKRNSGGGVYIYHYEDLANTLGSTPYIGGTMQIFGNYALTNEKLGGVYVSSNLYLIGDSAVVKQALGQEDDILNAPLTEGANIGITSASTDVLTDEDSGFDTASLKYLHSDLPYYNLKAVEDDDYSNGTLKFVLEPIFKIAGYNAQTKSASIYATKAGKYSLIFADYEDGSLENADVVEYDFKEGINVIPQKFAGFALASGDKVMLWHDLIDCAPVCDDLTLN